MNEKEQEEHHTGQWLSRSLFLPQSHGTLDFGEDVGGSQSSVGNRETDTQNGNVQGL